MELIQKAKIFAIAAHQAAGQKRKYTGEAYYTHCEEVAKLVEKFGGTPEQIAAAWLHDTVEDTQVSLYDIHLHFGPVVHEYVDDLTDRYTDKELGNRKIRKELERQRLERIHPKAQSVKYCDLLSNGKDIALKDRKFAKVYMMEKKLILKVMNEGDQGSYNACRQMVEEFFGITSETQHAFWNA